MTNVCCAVCCCAPSPSNWEGTSARTARGKEKGEEIIISPNKLPVAGPKVEYFFSVQRDTKNTLITHVWITVCRGVHSQSRLFNQTSFAICYA